MKEISKISSVLVEKAPSEGIVPHLALLGDPGTHRDRLRASLGVLHHSCHKVPVLSWDVMPAGSWYRPLPDAPAQHSPFPAVSWSHPGPQGCQSSSGVPCTRDLRGEVTQGQHRVPVPGSARGGAGASRGAGSARPCPLCHSPARAAQP